MDHTAVRAKKGATTRSFSAGKTWKDTRKTTAVGKALNRHGYREEERFIYWCMTGPKQNTTYDVVNGGLKRLLTIN
eukprot:scaffold34925_cov150-Amphora_coffeaeformis.AAC.3